MKKALIALAVLALLPFLGMAPKAAAGLNTMSLRAMSVASALYYKVERTYSNHVTVDVTQEGQGYINWEDIRFECGNGWASGTYQLTSQSNNNFKTNFDGRSSVNGSNCNVALNDD